MRADKALEIECRHSHARLPWALAAAALLYLGSAAPKAQAQTAAQLISTRSTAVPLPADGNGASVDPLISSDGRFVLFESTADNLTPGSRGGPWLQVYLRDRAIKGSVNGIVIFYAGLPCRCRSRKVKGSVNGIVIFYAGLPCR